MPNPNEYLPLTGGRVTGPITGDHGLLLLSGGTIVGALNIDTIGDLNFRGHGAGVDNILVSDATGRARWEVRTPVWSSAKAYRAGQPVIYSGEVYVARVNVPHGQDPPDTPHGRWRQIGIGVPDFSDDQEEYVLTIKNGAVSWEYNSGAATGTSYVHTQVAASAEWEITHNLGFFPNVTVIDSGGTTVIAPVEYVDQDSLILRFNNAFGGTAYLS